MGRHRVSEAVVHELPELGANDAYAQILQNFGAELRVALPVAARASPAASAAASTAASASRSDAASWRAVECRARLRQKLRGVVFLRTGGHVVVTLDAAARAELAASVKQSESSASDATAATLTTLVLEATRAVLPHHEKELRRRGQWPEGLDAIDVRVHGDVPKAEGTDGETGEAGDHGDDSSESSDDNGGDGFGLGEFGRSFNRRSGQSDSDSDDDDDDEQ